MKCPHCGGDITGLFQSLGGKARAESLSGKKRKDIARKAAQARWKGHTPAKKRKRGDELALGEVTPESSLPSKDKAHK